MAGAVDAAVGVGPSMPRRGSFANVGTASSGSKLTAPLYARFSSRGEGDFGDKVFSAMRFGFGGHVETVK